MASFAVGLSRLAYAGTAKALLLLIRAGSTELERALSISAARNTLKQAFRLNPWSTSRIFSSSQVLLKYGPIPDAIIAGATKTNAVINRFGAYAAAGAIVNYALGPSCEKSKSER